MMRAWMNTAAVAMVVAGGHAWAEVPAWAVKADLSALYASPLGGLLMDRVRQDQGNADAMLDRLSETLGLDPRTDIGQVVLFGDGFEEQDLRLVADLGGTTGKLEGWALGLPGYRSEDLDDDTLLHSFLTDDNHGGHGGEGAGIAVEAGSDGRPMHRLWAALPREPDGTYTLVMSFEKDAVASFARSSRERVVDLGGLGTALTDGALLSVAVNDLGGMKVEDDQPGSAVLRAVKSATMTLSVPDDVAMDLSVTTQTSGRARQLESLLRGLLTLPAFQLAMEGEPADPAARTVADLAQRVQLSQANGQPVVRARVNVTLDELRAVMQAAD